MTISLITSTLGRREILGRLLTSLEQQSYRDFQIIIVDQNPDGYLDAVLAGHRQTLNLHHIRSPKGVSRGRNAGLQASTGEILAFPDDDCWYPPELLSQAIALLDAHPDHGMILGRTVDASGINSVVPALPDDAEVNRDNVVVVANTNTIFMRRAAETVTGLFDEQLGPGSASKFQGAEDRDYVMRAVSSGIKVRYIRDLTVFHEQIDVSESGSHLARIRKYSLGDGAYYRKHGYGILQIAKMSLRAIGGIPLRILRGEAPELTFKLTYCYFLIMGYLHWTGEF